MSSGVLRAWPWTIALSVVLAGFVLLGLVGLSRRSSVGELIFSLAVALVAAVALSRALSLGVRITPSGLIIRDLTRTTPIPWNKIRSVSCEKSRGRGYVPVLRTADTDRLEVTVLAAYREPAAQQRAEVLAKALAATKRRR
jgi:hypothetical protein